MKKMLFSTILICVLFFSCTSTPVSTITYTIVESNNSRANNTKTASTTPQRAETEVVFTFDGPQGVNIRLYYNDQSIGTIEKSLRKTIPNNGVFTFKTQIGDETRELSLASRNSTIINVNLSARRTSSGIVITDFGIVNRSPIYSVRYVSVDGLNVRNNSNANAALLDTIPQDCKVEILEEYTNGWARIKYYNNKTGYVNCNYLTTIQPQIVVTSLKVGNTTNGI